MNVYLCGQCQTSHHPANACGPNPLQKRVDDLRVSYEAKVDDLRRETLRASMYAAVIRRLYSAYHAEARGRVAFTDVKRLFTDGFPPDEFEALAGALDLDGADELRSWAAASGAAT